MASRDAEMKRYIAQQARSRKRQARARQQSEASDYWENIGTTGKDVGKELVVDAAIGAATGGLGLLGRAAFKGGRKMHQTYKAGKKAQELAARGAAASRSIRMAKAKMAVNMTNQRARDIITGKIPSGLGKGKYGGGASKGELGVAIDHLKRRGLPHTKEALSTRTPGFSSAAKAKKAKVKTPLKKVAAKPLKAKPKAKPKKGQDAAERAMEKRKAYMESAEYKRNKAKRAAKPKPKPKPKREGY